MDGLKEALVRYFIDDGRYDVEDFIHAYGDPRQALLMFRAFFPEFSEVDGHVVLSTFLNRADEPQSLIARLRTSPSDVYSVLKGYRWIEVPYLFANTSLSESDDHLLARMLAHSWLAALSLSFPATRWVTRVLTPEETGSVVGVCFEEAV